MHTRLKKKIKAGSNVGKLYAHKFSVKMWIVSSFLESNLETSVNI